MSIETVIPQGIDAATDGQLFAREAMAYSRSPQLAVRVTAGAEASNIRRFTLRVVNRRGKDCLGLFALLVVIGTAAAGGPAGTQTVSIVSGATVQTIASNQAFILFTAANGVAELDVTVVGASSRYVRAGVLAVMGGTTEVAWT
ncbi:MAG: hypothetical protein EBR82_15430 [Caulobacteraceae bacterium]|nr:hypothetical protein [Caulobacteraceae bacterium]